MRTPLQRLAWLSIADGLLVAVLIRRWAIGDGPHHLIDAATVITLLLGFLGAAIAAFRRFRGPAAEHVPWFTVVAYSILMITLLWRWTALDKPYTALGAVTLSTLMLGFVRATATTFERLGHTGPTPASEHSNEQQDALLLFPAEDTRVNDRMSAPPVLATRRKALL